MSISAINATLATQNVKPQRKRSFLNPVSVTGYSSLGCAAGSIIAIKNGSSKWHKGLAYAATALAALHVGIVEWHNRMIGR